MIHLDIVSMATTTSVADTLPTGPVIRGKKTKRVATKTEDDVQATLETLDMQNARPVEENKPEQPNITDPVKETDIQEAKVVTKQNISDKQRATLAKAREALKEKRKRNKETAVNQYTPPDGQPSEDVLLKFQDQINKRFDDMANRLKDIQQYRPSEVPALPIREQQTPTHVPYKQPTNVAPEYIPTPHPPTRQQERIDIPYNGPMYRDPRQYDDSAFYQRQARKHPMMDSYMFEDIPPPPSKKAKPSYLSGQGSSILF